MTQLGQLLRGEWFLSTWWWFFPTDTFFRSNPGWKPPEEKRAGRPTRADTELGALENHLLSHHGAASPQTQ